MTMTAMSDGGRGHGRRCDYCLVYTDKTRVTDLGSIICFVCDEEIYQDTERAL